MATSRIPYNLSLEDATDGAQGIGLSQTVGSFANRLKRKLEAQKEQLSESEKARDRRHTLMLQAMTTIKKALSETSKISLGERFSFKLSVSDFEGWPKLELSLLDSFSKDFADFGIAVTASDRKDLGLISVQNRTGAILGQLLLSEENQIQRLPFFLKRSLREFLDSVGNYVLNPKKPEELLETQTKNLDSTDFDHISKKLEGENLFVEHEADSETNRVSDTGEVTPIDYR